MNVYYTGTSGVGKYFGPRAVLKIFLALRAILLENSVNCVLHETWLGKKISSAGRTNDLGEPDLARGPYSAHPCYTLLCKCNNLTGHIEKYDIL